jgi:hypothetical protein
MTMTQTVKVPENRRLIIDVPREIPTGSVILTFTPLAETTMMEFIDASNDEVVAVGDEILNKHIVAFKALAK